MNIGIIIYSQTGHTRDLALALKDRLERDGQTVSLAEVTVVEEKKKKGPVTLGNCPSIDAYDAVIFGSPVHGFSLSLEMKAYLTGLPTGQPKKASCFVTQGLGGGKRSNKQMKAICTEKGLEILETGIVTWPRKSSKAAREELIDRFARSLGK